MENSVGVRERALPFRVHSWVAAFSSSPAYRRAGERPEPARAGLYFLYRRSWGWGILAALASLLISLPGTLLLVLWSNDPYAQPASYLMFAQAASVYLTLAFRILFTLFSIRMIRSSAARRIQRLRRENPSDADFQAALAAHAGPSWVGVALYVAVVTAVSVVLMQFAGPELATVLFGG